MDEDFAFMILEVVSEIPSGKVASYGQIAKLAGFPKNARKVGKVMSNAELYGDEYPCHRVVHSDGKLVHGWKMQKILLAKEGIVFKKEFAVDMKKYQWEG